MARFKLQSKYTPSGDQPTAIKGLVSGIESGLKHQTLLGVTGSGKTYSVANVVQQTQKPTLVLAHNKTLAAQLYSEFKEFFPENAVEYFISYYDYYQPEAYVAKRDLYIEKETDINQDIERYRNHATQMALSRKDIIIVASVSCIYGLGDPEDYSALSREVTVGQEYPREKLLIHLTDMQYYRSEYDFYSGLYRVRGEVIDIHLVGEEKAIRIEFFGDTIDSLKIINPISGEILEKPNTFRIFPAKQYVTPFERIKTIVPQIRQDLEQEKERFLKEDKLLEATRLEQRVNYDLEMLEEVGYCTGIENYSRYFDGRAVGSPPSTLLDYLGEDWLLVVDESHMTLPQVRGMYNGDRARKEMLVNYGFRLRAALDNRPLKFEEFSQKVDQVIYVSATPSEYELELSKSEVRSKGFDSHIGVVQQIIRPTGLLDPILQVRPALADNKPKLIAALQAEGLEKFAESIQDTPALNQIDDLLQEVKATVLKGQRVLVTTLTKRMAEELTTYLGELGVKVQYIHSDIDAMERVNILRQLRLGEFDVLVGINLLREGLDLPEVSLVCILDSDKEGFLRSETAFIQVIGRAARHPEGRVIMYADRVTRSMKAAISETTRRRIVQDTYNKEHGLNPTAIISSIKQQLIQQEKIDTKVEKDIENYPSLKPKEKKEFIRNLKVKMELYADTMEFEKAAEIRDFLLSLNSNK